MSGAGVWPVMVSAVLLPARAVAAGAPDLTADVGATLANILASGTGGRTGPAPGDGR